MKRPPARLRSLRRVWLALALMTVAAGAGADGSRLLALCYHDVVTSTRAAAADPMAVTVDALVAQLAWLDAEGYQPITLDQWEAAGTGASLPEKPVLLTFDDGYASFSRHVLPLLKLFGFPAVLAPVTSWVDAPPDSQVQYGDESVSRDRFMTWAQVREAAASGLVEVASHSHDLHRGVIGNPFGNTQPAAITRRYDPEQGEYEDEDTYRTRVGADLARSATLLKTRAGVSPRAMVWPYGAHNAAATDLARNLGLDYSLTLDDAANRPGSRAIHRRLVGSDMDLEAFVMVVRDLYPAPPLRAAHVDLDYVYDPDPAQMGRNLDRLLDRIKALRINRVFLQAYADPDGDGVADALYFPNRHLPVRKDLFNRVAWQLKTRAGVGVFAWMPVLAFELPDRAQSRRLAVQAADGSHTGRYHRLSPFHPEARRIITEIYADLGRSSHFRGVLFHDDAFLGDQEDTSPAARAFYRRHWGGAGVDPDDTALARAKTRHLIDFTRELADELRRHQGDLETARNLYARVITHPKSERWFAQSLPAFLDSYDYTAVMAMPYMEEAENPRAWLADLVARVARVPGGLDRTVFELQTVDWRSSRPLADRVLAAQIDLLLDAGVRHLAWYPDDFIAGHPDLMLLRSRLSLADHPALLE